ncbi:hypothetical protein BZA05DRAFT_475205 [Tricharina praecox]|uniref:uncharacterized protein n=1 Tax=Tricharina praecox TaxID=43433 RepID=UPI00221EF9BC|nr:uncharacterized protein BZA05DRAFT_475205 [Tricharina praecox]KAI5848885.1 hypothetical protein BZA05DRAFT_475205 [Tricharina praecox]
MRRPNRANKPPSSAASKERVLRPQAPEGKVNFPCHEDSLDEEQKHQLRKMQLYPADGVSRYCRKIPFRGSKGQLFEITGRHEFNLYEYSFVANNTLGEPTRWWIMWDYSTGFVRVHDFFNCCKPGKTEPGNALKPSINSNLAAICPNITGGQLHAQGYWFPYEAARAMATRFCWRIRFALTIVFGKDFPRDCLDPEKDKEEFGRYNIDAAIIVACTDRVRKLKQIEASRSQKQRESKASSTSNFTPSNSRYATPPEGTYTPPRSTYPTASPELAGSMTKDQTTHGGRYFDPVRDSSKSGPFDSSNNSNSNRRGQHLYPSLPSPGGWANALPSPTATSPLNQYHHFDQQFLQHPLPESSVRMDRGSSSRYQPSRQYQQYSYAIGQRIPTPAHGIGGEGGGGRGYGCSPHQQMWRSPAEASIPSTPYYTPRQPHKRLSMASSSANPGYLCDTPLYPPIMPPPAEQFQEYTQPFSPALAPELPQVIPQRRESTEACHHLDPAHLSKRRRISGHAHAHAHAQGPEGFEHEDDYRARMFVRPPPPPPPQQQQPAVLDPSVEAEGDVAQAAAGLMCLNQQDIELERENSRRRNST